MSKALKLSDGEKLILVMLCDIQKKMGIEDSSADLIAEAIYSGNLWGLKWALTGVFHDSEPTDEEVTETVDILDMWSFIERGYADLSSADKEFVKQDSEPFGGHPRFQGFDGNNETQQMGVARFLIEKLDRFQEFKGRELNSHFPSIGKYRRMLEVFLPIRETLDGTGLSATQISSVLKAQTYRE